MTPATWLVDNSVLARLDNAAVEDVVSPLIRRGQLGVSILTELEVGYSARSIRHYQETRESIIDFLLPIALPTWAETRAREVQRTLIERGQHRAVSLPDLLIAATGEIEGLTVLHYDADFDLIAEITGQETEWVVPRGSI